MPRFAVILPAAGQSVRFGKPKLLALLDGARVIRRSVDAFTQRSDVAQIIVATNQPHEIKQHLPADPRIRITGGGSHRAATVRLALAAVDNDVEWIAVHDAARPLVSQDLIERVLQAAVEFGAAGPALPVHLTIRSIAGRLPARSAGSVARSSLVAMQTPQVTRAADLRRAFDAWKNPLDAVTDDLQLIESLGMIPMLVAGEERNLKITTPTDLLFAEMLLNSPLT